MCAVLQLVSTNPHPGRCTLLLFYYINTTQIPGEFSRENVTSSHVIFTCEKITVAMAT